MPRTHTVAERSAISSNDVQHLLFIEVANADGVLIDCSNLGAAHLDFADGAAWSESLDTMIQTGTLTIWRDTNTDSAAPPINATSTINRNALGAYAPHFEKGRAVRVRTATLIPGQALTEADKKVMFLGRIDTVHWHASPMTVDMSDLGAWLVDANIPAQKQYADKTGVLGAGPLLGAMIQSMIDDAIPPAGSVPLYQPVVSTWQPYSSTPQNPGSLFQAIYQWAQEIGWNIGYKFDATDAYRLTLYAPNRTNNVADWVIGPSEYTVVSNLSSAIADIRNKIIVDYIDASGAPQSVTVADAASIVKYGGPNAIPRLWRFASATIRNATDATALANAVLSDLAAAPVDLELQLPYFWAIQIDDMCTIQADGDHFDVDQLLAVVSYQHELKDGHGVTTIRLRGKVAGAYSSWIQKASTVTPPTPALPPTAVITADTAGATDTSINVTFNGAPGVGATALQWQYSQDGGAFTALSNVALPQTVTITRQAKAEKIIVLKVVQDDGQTVSVSYVVAGRMTPMDRTTGFIDRAIPWKDGLYGLKASDTSGNNASGTVTDSRGSVLNGMFRYGTDGAAGVVESGTQSFVHPAYLDARRPKILYDPTAVADVQANDINVGQARARGGFVNTTGGLVSTAIDARGAAISGMFRYGTDSSDGIMDGSGSPLAGGRRGYMALNTGNRLVTAVDETASIGQENAAALSKRAGIFFSEVFNQIPSGSAWGVSGSGVRTLVTDTSENGPRAGKNLLQSAGYSWFQWQGVSYPFNQSKLYRIRARVRCTSDGDGLCYMGFQQLLADGSTANPNGGNAYCVFSGDHLTVAQGWVERTVWVKGATIANSNTSIPPSLDPLSPTPLNLGTVQLNPIIAVGYPNPNGTGTFQIDYFQVEEFDEDAQTRTYNALQGGGFMGYLQPGVVDSRGSTIRTHFRYGGDDAAGVLTTTTRQFYDPTATVTSVGGYLQFSNGYGLQVPSVNLGFYGVNNYWVSRSSNGIEIQDTGGTMKGRLYFDSSGYGLLNSAGAWSMQIPVGTATPYFPNGLTAQGVYASLNSPVSNAVGSFVANGNCIEFGHANPAGYRSMLGTEAMSGAPFLAFHAEAGTSANTYRTRGIAGAVLKSDVNGGFIFGLIPNIGADNQALTSTAWLDRSGNFSITGNYTLNTNNVIQRVTNYHMFYDYGGTQALHLGGGTDANNYYSNNSHIFRSRSGASVFGIWNANGIIAGNSDPTKGIDLIGGGGVPFTATSSGSSYATAGYNQYPNGSGGWKYRATDAASYIMYYAGGFRFYSAPAGTAGATFTPSLLMEIYANNTVSINGTNGLSMQGFSALKGNGTYTMLIRPDAVVGIYVGNGTNWYDADTHFFRAAAGGTNFVVLNSANLAVNVPLLVSGNVSLNNHGTSFIDSYGNKLVSAIISSGTPTGTAEVGTLWIQY
jgi:hypothetical protein